MQKSVNKSNFPVRVLFSVRYIRVLLLLNITACLSSCASFGEGIAKALLESKQSEDTRVCRVWGKPFDGLQPGLSQSKGKTKVLKVHGVGDRLPGYATQLLENLAVELNLTVQAKRYKDISLTDPMDTSKNLGNLRVSRLLDETGEKELLFYELTWSEITAPQKALLGFDTSGEYSFRRAKVNDLMKHFVNDTGPDPILYLGESGQDILKAFIQSFCWMFLGWEDLPANGKHACRALEAVQSGHIIDDRYVLISHSLGSRITIDGLQLIAKILENPANYADKDYPRTNQADLAKLISALKNKRIPIYMLSNQLPMLQFGRELPPVTEQQEAYCDGHGDLYKSRLFSETSIIAFSDPNDLLSYGIPPGFTDQYLDSRLCVSVTNININIAKMIDVFGLGQLANPMEAHKGYDNDERVVALIAKGIGNPNTAEIVKKKCQWTKLID